MGKLNATSNKGNVFGSKCISFQAIEFTLFQASKNYESQPLVAVGEVILPRFVAGRWDYPSQSWMILPLNLDDSSAITKYNSLHASRKVL